MILFQMRRVLSSVTWMHKELMMKREMKGLKPEQICVLVQASDRKEYEYICDGDRDWETRGAFGIES